MSYIALSSLRHSCRILRRLTSSNYSILQFSTPIRNQLFVTQTRANRVFENLNTIQEKISKLDEDAREKGTINISDVNFVLNAVKNERKLSVSQSLMLIRCCGRFLAGEKLNEKTKLLQEIWKTIEDLKIGVDVSHYNALLKVYLENECDFSPINILADMKQKGCEPNRITYQRLIRRYCNIGDMEGATQILHFMREKELPVSVGVFNALIVGHSNVNDMGSACGILSVLKSAQMEPTPETITLLICGYVKQGNFSKVHELLKDAEATGAFLSYDDYFDIVYAYAKHGYESRIDEILEKIKKNTAYNVDAKNFVLNLIAMNKSDAAYRVLRTIQKRNRPDGTILPVGDFFVSQLIKSDIPVDKVIKYCVDMMNENLNPNALLIAMENSLKMGKEETAIALFKAAKRMHIDVRHHYFWPLLVQRGKADDCSGIIDILFKMKHEFDLTPNTELIREYVVPVLLRNKQDVEQIIFSVKGCGVTVAASVSSIVIELLRTNRLKEAADVGESYNTMYPLHIVNKPLVQSFMNTKDVKSFVKMLKDVSCGYHWFMSNQNTDKETSLVATSNYREATSTILQNTIAALRENGSDNTEIITNILQTMLEYKLGINEYTAEKLRKKLQNKTGKEIDDLLRKLSSADFSQPPLKSKGSRVTLAKLDEQTLERLRVTMKANNEDISVIQKYLFSIYARSGNEKKMSDLLKEMEETNFVFTVGMYMLLMGIYTDLGKLEEALKVYETICVKIPRFEFDSFKLLKLVHLLVMDDQVDRAMELMKTHVKKHMMWEDIDQPINIRVSLCRKILEVFVEKGDVENVNAFAKFLLSSGLGEANNIFLGPLVKVHVVRGDLEAAMKEYQKCVQKYRTTPWKFELGRALLAKEDAAKLQLLTDLSSEVHGEENSIHDLICLFIECGHTKQAVKIFETLDFRLNKARLLNTCYRYYNEGATQHIRTFLELTKGDYDEERSTMYYLLLSTYNKGNDVENAMVLWTEMQEDNVQPTNEFLITLAGLLERNNRPVPFDVPILAEQQKTLDGDFGKVKLGSASIRIRSLLNRHQLDEALEAKKKCKPEQLTKTDWSMLLEQCVQAGGGKYEMAKEIFNECVKITGELPLYKVSKFFMGAAMREGDIQFLETLRTILTEEEKKRLSFDNHLCRAYLNANRVDDYLLKLERDLRNVKSEEEMKSFLLCFPRGAVPSIMLMKPQYADRGEKLMLECLRRSEDRMIANALWIYYMLKKDYQKATEMWTSRLRDATEPLSFYKLTVELKRTANAEMGLKMVEFAESNRSILPGTMGVIYGHVINVLVQTNRIEDAIKLVKQADERIGVTNVMMSSVITLKAACASKNINFPFEISDGHFESGSAQKEHDEHVSEISFN